MPAKEKPVADKITFQTLYDMKKEGRPITVLTAYDYPTARLVEESGVDMILVGDSVGMVVHGFDTTLPVTMDMMVMHCQAVRRGARPAFIIGDMPFMSYQASTADALRNAGRLLAEGGMDAVKLEGGRAMLETVHALVQAGIAVQGHIGLTPQSVSAMGGFRVQGRGLAAAHQLVEDALLLQEAGVFSIVLESIPARLAAFISQRLEIPTIGIGAGAGCDGQVLVLHDVLGLYAGYVPRFVKRYASLDEDIKRALAAYSEDVRARRFPAEEHSYAISDQVMDTLAAEFGAKTEA